MPISQQERDMRLITSTVELRLSEPYQISSICDVHQIELTSPPIVNAVIQMA